MQQPHYGTVGFQVYWLLKQPEAVINDDEASKVKGILKGIADAIGGDSVSDLARILRIPGSINQKTDKEGGKLEAKNVEIIKLEPSLTYALEDFARFQGEKTQESKQRADVSFSENIQEVNIDVLDISSNIRDLIKFGDTQKAYPSRSECDQVVITALVSKGHGPDVIKAIFSDENNKIGEKYREERINKGDAYLETSIQKAIGYLQSKGRAEINRADTVPPFPLEAFPTTGFLGQYIQYASQYTDAPVQFHIATALSVFSIVVNRKLFIRRGFSPIFPVLWVIVLAESGTSRKSTTQDIGLSLLSGVLANLKGSNEFSKEGLIKELSENSKRILTFTEVSTLLTQVEASYNRGLKPILISLFDAPTEYKRTLKESSFSIIV